MPSKVELIAYADRFGGNVAGLHALLDGPLRGLFGGVHVLPFYRPHDGADAGFDPQDHTEVDPRLGSWDDIAALGAQYQVMADMVVNHVSSSSPPFRDWLANGQASPFAGMFLTYGTAFPGGATEDTLLRLYRPRPGLPFTPVFLADGRKALAWTTFTPEQVDVDVRHPATRAYLLRVLDKLAAAGVRKVRLDAVGYAVKTPGTTSFMTPETFEFIDEITGWCRQRDLSVMVEVHSHYLHQVEIARQVDYVYDFALPPLVLHALTAADGGPLMSWLQRRPGNAVTVLDTHDGIGVIDVGADAVTSRPGLLGPGLLSGLVEAIHAHSGGSSRRATGAAAANVDLYQVNCTFYDALGRDDDRYLLARALQFWTPGIPQVYYVGLLAGGNDMELLARTGVGRDVNRHHYTIAEIDADLARPVVRALCRLIRFRNGHPAFGGDLTCSGNASRIVMSWACQGDEAVLVADLAAGRGEVTWTHSGTSRSAPLASLPASWP
ncbi:MAG TPA: sucrose phosphorylase [Streptosporangiaceae bacterium]|nr:sucrose phosphorylase [Streptosporangiaceae bacterium]